LKEVRVIQASTERVNRRDSIVIERVRVAAYCRVSTDTEEQKLSYDSQVTHYRHFVSSNSDWELVEIYTDEAISGTQINNRVGFQNMIRDALDDKIDLIVTKSISRFARNTLDTLKYVRMLKERNVAVLFEKENINTLTMNGEMLLVILSSLAQQESESISANVKMGLKMKMKRGELVGFHGCLGYDYDPESKTLTVNKEEAKVVKYIFRRYVEGAGSYIIAKELMQLGYKTNKGNTSWSTSTVGGILKNEKYKGDLMLGKTFTVDPITHRRLMNFGEEDKFYMEDHHEPIISKEVFEEAQRIRAKRSGKKSRENGTKREKYSRKYAFSSMMKCGFCGSTFSRRSWHGGSQYKKVVWTCVTSTKKGRKYCEHSKSIKEADLEQAFLDAFNMMCKNHKGVVVEFLKTIEESISSDSIAKKAKNISKDINKYDNNLSRLVELNIDGLITKEEYEKKYTNIIKKLENLKEKQQSLESDYKEQDYLKKKINSFKSIFNSNQLMTEFDREIFENVIDVVILGKADESGIKNPYSVTFVFKTGLKVEEDCTAKKSLGIHESDDFVCSYSRDDTRGDYCTNTKERISEIAVFTRATSDFKFIKDGRDFRNKIPVGELEITIAVVT
jgi:DNA invertase Pin-like site-specific DNA recombinase